MIRTFLIKCRMDIQRTISTPTKGYFRRNESSIRLCYLKDGKPKYINHLVTPLLVARFLKKHRIIDWFTSKDDYQVKMYRFNCILLEDLTWKRWREPIEWNDLQLTASQVETIAAEHETAKNKHVKEYLKKYFTPESKKPTMAFIHYNEDSFASPHLCEALTTAGLTDKTDFAWIKHGQGVHELRKKIGYYEQPVILKEYKTLPAFNITDLEKCLPDWLMTKDSSGYEISLDKFFGLSSQRAATMVDAIAALLLDAIRNHAVDLKQINYRLLNSKAAA